MLKAPQRDHGGAMVRVQRDKRPETFRNCYIYNQFHKNLRLFGVLSNFPFTTSETMGDYSL